MLATYGHYLSEVEHRWEGDRLIFSGKAKGMKASGTCKATGNPDGSTSFACEGTYSLPK